MNRPTKKIAILAAALVILAVGGYLAWRRTRPVKTIAPAQENNRSDQQDQTEAEVSPEATPPAKTLPEQFVLEVPFTSQAPHANWDVVHEDTCEEAAILMADRYFAGQSITSKDEAEAALQEVIAWQKANLGFFESTTAEQTARVAREFYGLKTEIIDNPTIEQIKLAIVDNKLVIVPAAGRELGNPHYTPPGPVYHMLLIRGWTGQNFITNDAGVWQGEGWQFTYETVMSANRDWDGKGALSDQKRIIIVWQ